MQYVLQVIKMLKFAAILVYHSHQSSLGLEWVVTKIKQHVTYLACFTSSILYELQS